MSEYRGSGLLIRLLAACPGLLLRWCRGTGLQFWAQGCRYGIFKAYTHICFASGCKMDYEADGRGELLKSTSRVCFNMSLFTYLRASSSMSCHKCRAYQVNDRDAKLGRCRGCRWIPRVWEDMRKAAGEFGKHGGPLSFSFCVKCTVIAG